MADETTERKREHTYHAEATVLSGDLYHPLPQEIKPQTNAKLFSKESGYLSEHAEPYRLEGVISFDRAYTQVAGNPNSRKPEKGWNTLVTSVVEGLNVLDVVTADRVVGQIATHHTEKGYVPRIHFLGTRFENLRIAGHLVKVNLHKKHPYSLETPEDTSGYTGHEGFLERVKTLVDSIKGGDEVPEDLLTRYKNVVSKANGNESIEGSLVTGVEDLPFGRGFGHVIDIPDFGKIHLAVLKITHSDYGLDYDKKKMVWKKTLVELKMIELELGCIAGGMAAMGSAVVGGSTDP
jgi:hypothetical protein